MALRLDKPNRRDPPLHVIVMGVALVLAAFAGAAIGLVWQGSGLGEEQEEEAAQSEGEGDETPEG